MPMMERQNLMKLSNPIERKYIASGSSSRWNENRLRTPLRLIGPNITGRFFLFLFQTQGYSE